MEEAFSQLLKMLKGHAAYEDERLHALLKKKNSKVHEHAVETHACQDKEIESLKAICLQAKCMRPFFELGKEELKGAIGMI